MTTSANQELKWKLVGIQTEKAKAAEYVNFLSQQEAAVQAQLSGSGQTTGTASRRGPGRPAGTSTTTTSATNAPAKSARKSGRKRQISPETRRKMSEAQRARHNKGNVNSANTGETVTAHAQAFEVPEVPQTVQ